MNSERNDERFVQLYLLKSQFFDEINRGDIEKAKEIFTKMDSLYKSFKGEGLTDLLTTEELDKIDSLYSIMSSSKTDNIKSPTELDQFLR